MTRSQRLDPLLRVVQQRQDDAARLVAERERAQAEQEERLDALRRYADEYANAPTATTIAPALLVNRLAFRAKLDAAVAQQNSVVDHGRQHCEVERTRLVAGGEFVPAAMALGRRLERSAFLLAATAHDIEQDALGIGDHPALARR